MAGLVLTDASPLIGLTRVDGLQWLQHLFGEIHMPKQVADEVLTGRGRAGEPALGDAIEKGWLRVENKIPRTPRLPDVDEGEAACIRLGLAQDGPCLLLMDERAGRELARELGLKVAGTAAIIGMAKSNGLIPAARPIFARLHASDFRISPAVIQTVLNHIDEA